MTDTRYDNAIKLQRHLLDGYLKKGMVTADMTMGNGNDTLFLSRAVGPLGIVYSFDIQGSALNITKKRLESAKAANCRLIHDSHANCDKYIAEAKIDAAVFNLGYLPGGDKSIYTKPESTIAAVDKLLELLKRGAAIYIVAYTGHDDMTEYMALREYAKMLDQKEYNVLITSFENQINDPSYLIIIEKR